MSLQYEPSSEPLHNSAKSLAVFLSHTLSLSLFLFLSLFRPLSPTHTHFRAGGVGGVAHGGMPPALPRRHHRHPVQHWSSSLPNLRPTPVTISDIFSSKSDMSPGQTPNPTASERRGDNLTGFKDFYLNAKAKIWP